MQMIADLHTHTLCATHAFQTLNEMAAAAKDCGYKALAITDHAPAMPDAPHRWHFENPTALPRTIDGMVMLYGAEANVVDAKGHLDLPPRILEYQDWVVASIHSPCVPGLLTRKEANRIWLAVAENPYVDCIGHSEQENYRYDYDLVTKAFAANHKVVELNGNSFNVRKDGIPNMKALLAACLQNGCHIACLLYTSGCGITCRSPPTRASSTPSVPSSAPTTARMRIKPHETADRLFPL